MIRPSLDTNQLMASNRQNLWGSNLDKSQTGIKISRRNINNLTCADDTTLMAESEEELKSLLMKVKEESEKPGLKPNIQKMKIMASSLITSWQIEGENVKKWLVLFPLAPKWLRMVTEAMKLRYLYLGRSDKPRQYIKKQRHHFANKGTYSQSYGFSSSHVGMWELDCREGWAPKTCCFWIVVLENTLESPLDSKQSKAVNHKENQPWICIGRTDAEADTTIL